MQLVVSKAVRTVPYPLLGENTLVLSDSLVLAKDENGDLALMFRSASHASCLDQKRKCGSGILAVPVTFSHMKCMFVGEGTASHKREKVATHKETEGLLCLFLGFGQMISAE